MSNNCYYFLGIRRFIRELEQDGRLYELYRRQKYGRHAQIITSQGRDEVDHIEGIENIPVVLLYCEFPDKNLTLRASLFRADVSSWESGPGYL